MSQKPITKTAPKTHPQAWAPRTHGANRVGVWVPSVPLSTGLATKHCSVGPCLQAQGPGSATTEKHLWQWYLLLPRPTFLMILLHWGCLPTLVGRRGGGTHITGGGA